MDIANIETLAGPALVALYNEKAPLAGEKPVNKFSDRTTAIKRVRALLNKIGTTTVEEAEDAGIPDFLKKDAVSNPINPPAPAPAEPKKAKAEPAPKKAKAEPKAKAAPKAKAERKVIERKPRGMRFFFPVSDEIKIVRPGTHRAKLVELLARKEGATFEECQKATGWDKKTCYEGIRLLHYYVGYGMTQDANGRIHLKNN